MTKACRKIYTTLLLAFIILPFLSKAQSGDLSQIRNGNGKASQQGVLDTCGTCWVNGNAGASNAHYVEGMSIAYRSLLTLLTPGVCYEYELGFDTYHGGMAIDYLTHFQRLDPHQPFGHLAEVVNPLILLNGSTPYTMGTIGTATFPIPAPNASGIASGALDQNGNPFNISNQPVSGFNALPANQRVMTIYNGVIQQIYYVSQAPITIGGADAETRIRIRFVANDDSVMLAWGGHIASRLDWGYSLKQGKLTPLSAGGISGSPYHMRQKAFYRVDCGTGNNPVAISGFGNQDRSLAAAAVIPPPTCPTVQNQVKCLQDNSFTFTITNPDPQATYQWSFGTNNVGAAFNNGVNTGTSVTIIHNGGGSFTTGGTFTLNILATKNQIPLLCEGVATGTVIDVAVDALDADNAFTIDLNATTSQSLGIESISPGTTADYSFLWKVVSQPAGGNSSITNATSANATFNVLSPFAQGVYTVRVIATQLAAPFCKDSSTVTITATGGTNCGVSGPSPVCPGSQDNVYFYDPDKDGIPNSLPANFTALWSFVGSNTHATFDGALTGNSVKVDVDALGSVCNTSYTVRLTLTSVSGAFMLHCDTTVRINDVVPPVITSCPADATLNCGASTDPNDLGKPTFTDNCGATASYHDATVSNCSRTVITRTWVVTDFCGNKDSCTQIIILADVTPPTITCPANLTGAAALSCGASILPANTGTPTVSDNCSATGNIVVYYKDVYDANAACGTITRTWHAVDEAGNEKTCVQTIGFTTSLITMIPDRKLAPIVTNQVLKAKTEEAAVKKTTTTPSTRTGQPSLNRKLQISAFPNPFKNTVTFSFSSPESGKAVVELYNMTGQKLGTVFEGNVKAGVVQNVQYKSQLVAHSTVVYRLTVNGKSVNGKLVKE